MKDFLIIFVLMILTDLFYLKTTSKYFEKQIFLIQKTPMTLDLTSALFCYLFLSFGLYYFIIKSNKYNYISH